MCGGKVYLLERHIDGNTLYHRHCFRTSQRAQPKPSTYTASLRRGDSGELSGTTTGNRTIGLFETQSKNSDAQDSVALGNKSLSPSGSSQITTGRSPARNHPYSRQPASENKVDKIAELFNETDSSSNKSTSSKNLLLLGYTSNAYKPAIGETTSVFSSTSSTGPKTTYGMKTASSVETKAPASKITEAKTEFSRTPGNNVRSKSPTNSSAGTRVTVVGRPKLGSTEDRKEGLQTDGSTVLTRDKPSDSNVVSGLLQSLAHVRNNDREHTQTNKPPSQVTSGVVPSRTVHNANANVSKTGANVRNPINPNRRYLQIKSSQNVPKTSTTVSSQSSKASITQSSSSTATKTETVTVTTTKPNIPDTNLKKTPVSITTEKEHSTGSSVLQTQEKKPNWLSHNETTTKKPKSILKIRATEPSAQTDDFEIDWTTPDPTLKENGQSMSLQSDVAPTKTCLKAGEGTDFPVAPPRKSILKNKELRKVQTNPVHLNIKPNRPPSPKKEINTFKLTDSIEMSEGRPVTAGSKNARNELQKVEIEIRSQEENSKPEWMLEAEKRQKMRGGKYIDPEKKWKDDVGTSKTSSADAKQAKVTNQAARIKHTLPGFKEKIEIKQQEKWTMNDDLNQVKAENSVVNKVKLNGGITFTQKLNQVDQNAKKDSARDNKPEWMIEAERRIAERNGQYKDPEKKANDSQDGGVRSPSSPPPGHGITPESSPRMPISPHSPGLSIGTVSPSSGGGSIVVSPRHKKRQAPPRPDVPPYRTSPNDRADISPGRRLVPASLPLNPLSPSSSPDERFVDHLTYGFL